MLIYKKHLKQYLLEKLIFLHNFFIIKKELFNLSSANLNSNKVNVFVGEEVETLLSKKYFHKKLGFFYPFFFKIFKTIFEFYNFCCLDKESLDFYLLLYIARYFLINSFFQIFFFKANFILTSLNTYFNSVLSLKNFFNLKSRIKEYSFI